MKNTILIFTVLLFSCCNHKTDNHVEPQFNNPTGEGYENKNEYFIKVGDSLEIFHTTNTCCQYCCPNMEELKHLKYVGRKNVELPPDKCEGCNWTSALIFVATSVGKDTILDGKIRPLRDCSDTTKGLTKRIVNVN